ncbi:hypothetical protein Pla8534_25060 [Lignipirellula cremea]|uniref:DUF4254 domain-containing protein n=2 Tax=Lignipirellula cremea TaxID=2528010 RepID=A0A518DS77_9BACT|nr:hypothetical protein Pla8534_25060 [Lignipirellula cremea]
MIDVKQISQLHRDMVVRWHAQDVDNPSFGFLALVCAQHGYNFRLWHEEDSARCPEAIDRTIANVKRAIDKLNQKRNDAIEKLDDWIADAMIDRETVIEEGARLNTETPASVIDRLSILSLRIYHLEEQLDREDACPQHIESVGRKLTVCYVQQSDLTNSLTELLADIFAGRKRHRVYRQFKMYNDPSLNPYLYTRETKMVG